MEKVERGELKRVAVSIGPQLGKSEIISRRFPAWCAGRNPYRNMILGTYNQTFAEEFGADVRHSIESPLHQAVFPDHRLVKGALDLLITTKGGKTAFVGVGGSGTGKPADFLWWTTRSGRTTTRRASCTVTASGSGSTRWCSPACTRKARLLSYTPAGTRMT